MTTAIAEQNLIQRILNSDLGRKVIKDQKKETLSERKEHVKAIQRLEADAEIEFPKLREQADKELEKIREVEAELKAAREKYNRSRMAISSKSSVLTSKVVQHEQALMATADPAIDSFLSWANGRLESLRNTQPMLLKSVWLIDGSLSREYDVEGLAKTRRAVEEIYEQGQALKMKAVDDVPGELAKLRAEIPRNNYTEGWNFE